MGTRRACSLLAVLTAIFAAVAAAPAAVPEPVALRTFSDPQRWFTIGFPPAWTIKSKELNPRAIRNGVLMKGRVLIVHAKAEHEHTYVAVIAGLLREPMSPQQFAEANSIEPEDGDTLREVQKGETRVDGRDAYYRYLNVDSAKGTNSFIMLVYVVAGRAGFELWGESPRDAGYLQRSVPLIQRILESFRVGKISLPRALSEPALTDTDTIFRVAR